MRLMIKYLWIYIYLRGYNLHYKYELTYEFMLDKLLFYQKLFEEFKIKKMNVRLVCE